MFEMFKQFFGGEDYFGSKPEVPKYPTSREILDEMIAANEGALPGVTNLAGKMDDANFDLYQNQLGKVAPGFMGSIGQTDKNIASRVEGNIPDEVQAALGRSAAARSFMSGTSGGANTSWQGALTARDLGRTSYDIQRQGEGDLERFGGALKGLIPSTDVRSMLWSPEQTQQIMEQKWNEEFLRAKIAGAPDPVARGRADQEMALFGMIMGAYSGGPGYQKPSGDPSQQQPGLGGGGGQNWNMGTGGGGWSGGVDYNYGNFPTQAPAANQAPATTVSPWGDEGGGIWG